ncbi:MAG: 4Fe-4S binding protein [Sphaerochaetaceae bacterium]|nr:4Fe-4S binding protein [Sphaerochaetaceae bacterium]
MAIDPKEIKRVKGEGFLLNRGTDKFSGRIVTGNGTLSARQMKCACEAAERFGDGTMAFTSRMTVEFPGIYFDDIPKFQEYIAQEGMFTGGTGAKVRPVVCCKGSTCVFGLYDTQELCAEIHERFYDGYHDVALPHKFKIACGGCPNNCVKPDINDFGIVGQAVPVIDESVCKTCRKCQVEMNCPMHAVRRLSDGKVAIDTSICNNCGRCVGNCPFKAIGRKETLFKIYVGGRWGKHIRMGTVLHGLHTKTEALDMIEKALLLFKSEGMAGERFGNMIDRLGVDYVQRMLTSDELLSRKAEVLSR